MEHEYYEDETNIGDEVREQEQEVFRFRDTEHLPREWSFE
jgi:hypothetical protein